jgi:alkylation response protein AidB-like acyl-CoA dehydrogenase
VSADTAAFQAVMEQMVTLAARVEALEARDDTDLAALGIVYDAGKDAARRELGLASVHAPRTPRPRHLRTVRGKR